jgi:MFS family permease
MAAGTQATRQGWRWSYRTLGICNAIIFVLFLFFYEETKYSKGSRTLADDELGRQSSDDAKIDKLDGNVAIHSESGDPDPGFRYITSGDHEVDSSIPMRSWSSRLAFYTYTDESIWPHFYRPFVILVSFPAVMCCALQYACGVIWLTVMSSVLAIVFPQPPYLFTPEQVGFMSVGPFIGNLIGSLYGGFLGDRTILHYSRRNKGFYEPEMRLYILHVPAVTMCAGLIMFGVTIDRVGDSFCNTKCSAS